MIQDDRPLVQMVFAFGRQAVQPACRACAVSLPLGHDISVCLQLPKRSIQRGTLDLGISQRVDAIGAIYI